MTRYLLLLLIAIACVLLCACAFRRIDVVHAVEAFVADCDDASISYDVQHEGAVRSFHITCRASSD